MSYFSVIPEYELLRHFEDRDPFHGTHSRREVLAAQDAFVQAMRQGFWYRLRARLRRHPYTLHRLATLLQHRSVGARHAQGVQLVPLAAIRGSEGKADLFDRHFHPLQRKSRTRWLGIALARERGQTLPPVALIRVEDGADAAYFVRDGHHRISVARAYGQEEIEAEVTVWRLRGCVAGRDCRGALAPAFVMQ